MKTKKILFGMAALMLVILALSSFTKDRSDFQKFFQRSPEMRANVVSEIMKNKLSLNNKQFDKVYQVNLKYAKLSQPYLQEENSGLENKDKLIEINNNRREELKAILTPEQLKQASSIRKQWIKRLEIVLEQLKQNDISNE